MSVRGGLAAAALVAVALGGCTQTAAMAEFRATLARHDSATVALEEWCGQRAILVPGHVLATVQDDADRVPVTAGIRAALGVASAEPVRARHVLLSCGGVVLSDARNWYVPARLTPAMNTLLDTTQAPFGKVVAPLGPHRQPLPPGMASPAPCPAATIHHVTAVLRRNDGQPISLVSECYTRANTAAR
ncbi:hypothetical protein [Novosphingobium sp.]|uniref:chorismate--pyruvate lyase family protein n=1 Tax=Novosphingobium sp. TaxID=1874826 RepID=UPI00333EA114